MPVITFIQLTTEIAPGAGTKVAARLLPDSIYLQRVELAVGPDGEPISFQNPIPVSTNYEKIIDAINKSKWLELCVFDRSEFSMDPGRTSFSVTYFEDGYVIALAQAAMASDFSWSFDLFRYVVDDDGTILTEDDDSDLILE